MKNKKRDFDVIETEKTYNNKKQKIEKDINKRSNSEEIIYKKNKKIKLIDNYIEEFLFYTN